MSRPLAALLVSVLVGCVGAPADRLSWREATKLVLADDSGMFMEARISRGNTGLLRGQAQLELTVYPARDSAVQLLRTAPPQAVIFDPDGGSLRVLSNRLEQDQDGWTLHVREGQEALDATIHLTPEVGELPPVTLVEGQRQWLVGAPVPLGQVTGAWRAGKQGGLVRGTGMLIRQSTDTWPSTDQGASSLYLFGNDLTLAVETVGQRSLCWLVTPEGLRSGGDATLERDGRRLAVSLEPSLPVTASVKLQRQSVSRERWDHLLPFERLFARLAAGWPRLSFERGRARVRLDGVEHNLSALLVHGRLPPPRAPSRRAKAKAGEPGE